MTIEEYNRLSLVHNARAQQQLHEESKYMRENADELVSKYRRQQLTIFREKEIEEQTKQKEEERESYTACDEIEETETEAPALGKWQTIVRKYEKFCKIKKRIYNDIFYHFREEKFIDLQLPTTSNKDYGYIAPVASSSSTTAPTTESEPPQRVFKEKTVTTLADTDCNVSDTFKKRKFGGNKRNVRQRLNDDD